MFDNRSPLPETGELITVNPVAPITSVVSSITEVLGRKLLECVTVSPVLEDYVVSSGDLDEQLDTLASLVSQQMKEVSLRNGHFISDAMAFREYWKILSPREETQLGTRYAHCVPFNESFPVVYEDSDGNDQEVVQDVSVDRVLEEDSSKEYPETRHAFLPSAISFIGNADLYDNLVRSIPDDGVHSPLILLNSIVSDSNGNSHLLAYDLSDGGGFRLLSSGDRVSIHALFYPDLSKTLWGKAVSQSK